MLDYRAQSVSSVNEIISKLGKSEELRELILDGLVSIAVWHSIKDGQTTPAKFLVAAVRGKAKEQVVSYLTKFGNMKYTIKTGLEYCKAKGKVQYGIDKANEVFETLPTLEEAFPAKPKQYKDIPFMTVIKGMLNRAAELQEHGKAMTLASDEEKALFAQMQKMVSQTA